MDLSDAQVHHFRTFGYLALPRLFAPDEIAWVIEEFETAIQSLGGGDRHDERAGIRYGGRAGLLLQLRVGRFQAGLPAGDLGGAGGGEAEGLRLLGGDLPGEALGAGGEAVL